MPQLGRTFIVRASLAANRRVLPIAAATVVSQAVAGSRERWSRRRTEAPYLSVVLPVLSARPSVSVVRRAIEKGRQAFTERLVPHRADVPLAIAARGPPPLYGLFTSGSVGATYITSYQLGTGIGLSSAFLPRTGGGVRTTHRAARQPPLFLGQVVSQAVERSLTRRNPPPPHLATGIAGVGAFPGSLVVSQALQRAYIGRRAPAPHVAPPLTAALQSGRIVSQAFQSQYFGRTVPRPHLAPPVTGPLPLRPAVVVSQALARQLVRREGRVLLPRLGSGRPSPSGTFVSQALRRPYVGRSTPGPHLAPAVLQVPVLPGRFVSQAIPRALIGRTPPRPHLPQAIFGAPPLQSLIVLAAVRRAQYQRDAGMYVSRKRGGTPPLRPGTFVSQAVQRSQLLRDAPPPHVSGPVVGIQVPSNTVHSATIVSQAIQRAYIGRQTAQAPLVSPPAQPTPALGYVVVSNDVIRPLPWSRSLRSPLHPQYARPVVPFAPVAPVARGTFVYQATERAASYVDSGAQAFVSQAAALPRPLFLGLVVSQAKPRALTRRAVPFAPRRARAVVPNAKPVRYIGTFVFQALRAAQLGRGPFPPKHLAGPIVGPPPILLGTTPLSTLVRQAVPRALVGRQVPAPHLARPIVPAPPVRRAFVVSQAVQRAQVGRGPFPRQTAPRPKPTQFIVTKPTIIGQAIQRNQERYLRDNVPRPHLASAVLARRGPGATIKLQSQARALVDRRGRVRLPPPSLPTPLRPAVVISQALQRPYAGRTVPKPHVAKANAQQARGATIVLQAIRRPYVGRTVPKPHLPPSIFGRSPNVRGTFVNATRTVAYFKRDGRVRLPKLGGRAPVRRGTFVSQAIQRPFVGRQAGHTFVGAKPVVTQPTAPIVTFPKVVLQAIQRSLIGRKVPPPPRYGPIVFPTPVPFFPRLIITRKGSTSPFERSGVTSPRPTRNATTNPLE